MLFLSKELELDFHILTVFALVKGYNKARNEGTKMNITIYADVLFATNFLMDLVILFLTMMLGRIEFCLRRLTLATTLLALYGTVSFLPELQLFFSMLGKILAGAVAVWMLKPQGGWRGFLKARIIFSLVSAGIGGVVYALVVGANLGRELQAVSVNGGIYFLLDIRLLLAGIFVSYGLLFVFRNSCIRNFSRDRILVPLSFQMGEETFVLTALIDTGCELTAPLTGEGALLIPQSILGRKTPKESFWLPARTAGGESQLPAFYPETVECLDSRYEFTEVPVIGLLDHSLSRDGLYSGILNPQLLRETKKDGGRKNDYEVKTIVATLIHQMGILWSQGGLLHRGKRNPANTFGARRGGGTSFPTGRSGKAGGSQTDAHRTESSVGCLHSTEV